MRTTCLVLVFFLQTFQCLAADDSPFQLLNKATSSCLVKSGTVCQDIRWTTGGRLLVESENKCLGVQGKSVGSGVQRYDCDENSELQRWECVNETLLGLQGQGLYIELKADDTAALSKTTGPNNHFTISGTSSGACTRTYRELYTIEGNAAGRLCMFPFYYSNQWYSSCTFVDSPDRLWCAVETTYEHETWGYCPTNNKDPWKKDPTSGANYQLNTWSALTWQEAETSCKQQSSSLLSITDPHQQAFITALLEAGGSQGSKLWTGLTLNQENGWKWSNGNPFRYLKWDSGHPLSDPGHTCGFIDGALRYAWQSSRCDKKIGYICYSEGVLASPTEGADTGFCSAPWLTYNNHCFLLQRTEKTWSDAQLACRKEGGDLMSIRNVEDQSFVISQLGYASTDELWIGLNDRKTEGLFDWSDHSTVSFTSWEFGKPTVTPGGEDCVLIRGASGNWADRDCKEKHDYICMKSSTAEPSGDVVNHNPGCRTDWRRYGSYCYFIGAVTKTFDEAKDECRNLNSYLADVSTRVDNAFLVSLVGLRAEKHFWLGLSNQKDKDVFSWTNTDSVKYTHWNAEMPGNHQGCVAMATRSFAGLWDVLPCTNREKYICKHLAEGAVLTPAPPTVPSTKCEDGWNKVVSRNFCYKTYLGSSNQRTWSEARDYCIAIGGDLLSIHSSEELQLQPRRYGKAWIGFSAPDLGAGYVWSDGSPVNFQHWKYGEPNNQGNSESCGEFFLHEWDEYGSWNDAHCDSPNGWVCQIRTGVTPKPPPPPPTPDYNTTSDGWMEWKGNQYFLNKQTMAMEDARQFCKNLHGDLATINSEAENTFLKKQLHKNSGDSWIGLNVDLDKTVQWMDGSQALFQKWDEQQPNFINFDENCVVMRSYSGLWHDYNCGYEFRSICKRSSSPPVNATVAPTESPKGGCKDTWKKFNSKCYKLMYNLNLTWDDARQHCRDAGGNLASVSSRHVQVFLMSQMVDAPTTDLWIGLHNSYKDGFYWTDGRKRSYTNLVISENRGYPHYHRYDRYRIEMSHDIPHRIRWLGHSPQYFQTCAVIGTKPLLSVGKWIPKSCNDTNGFICLQNIDSSLPDSPEPTTSTNYVKILNDSIKLVPQQMSWDEARKHCERDGAHLASVRNEWTQSYIELMVLNLKRPLWIGLNKDQTKNYFKFTDGWSLKFTRWDVSEPRRTGSCVYVDVNGKWKTSDCNRNISSVCMKSTDVPPTERSGPFPGVCPEDIDGLSPWIRYSWKPYRGNCYMFFPDEKEWPNAAANCVTHGGLLASIEDPFEEDFIKRNIETFRDSHSSYWIGLYQTHKGEWKWLDKTVLDYTNWREGQPASRSGNPYGLISSSDGGWGTASRWYDRPYICKTPKVLLKSSSPTPSPNVVVPRGRRHITLVVVLVIIGLGMGTAIAFFLFKKSGRTLSIPNRLTAFDNPLFLSNTSQPSSVDNKKLVENVDEENTEPVIII